MALIGSKKFVAAVLLSVAALAAAAVVGLTTDLFFPSDTPPLPPLGPRQFLTRETEAGTEIHLLAPEGLHSEWYRVVPHSDSPVVRFCPPASDRREWVAAVHEDGTVTMAVMGPGEFRP